MTNNLDEHMAWVSFLAAVRPYRPEWRSPIEASLQMEHGFMSDKFGQQYLTEYIQSLKQELESNPEDWVSFQSDPFITFELGDKIVVFDLEAMGPDPAVRWANVEEYIRTRKSKFIKTAK